jgi:hypothetical protein
MPAVARLSWLTVVKPGGLLWFNFHQSRSHSAITWVFRMYKGVFLYSLALAIPVIAVHAGDEFEDVKLIRELPISDYEVKSAYRQSRTENCEQVPDNEPLELNQAKSVLSTRDRHLAKGPPLPSMRKSVLSIGLQIRGTDRNDLPTLSRSRILDYLDKHYLNLQARVRKDLLDRKPYYHHRPLAATCNYLGSKLTQKFEGLVAITTKNIRSLGDYVEPEVGLIKAEHLRTIVLLFPCELIDPTTNKAVDQFEWVFVRGVPTKKEDGLDSHVFVSKNKRDRLVYLRPYATPSSPRDCGVLGNIVITNYDRTGIFPQEAATRSFRIATRNEYTWQKLEDYSQQQFGKDLSIRLNQVLDAIIEGKIEPDTAEPFAEEK